MKTILNDKIDKRLVPKARSKSVFEFWFFAFFASDKKYTFHAHALENLYAYTVRAPTDSQSLSCLFLSVQIFVFARYTSVKMKSRII